MGINLLKERKKNLKTLSYIRQRLERGYSDSDLWNFDSYLSQILTDGLKDFIKNLNSYPGSKEFPTFEIWTEYLQNIVKDFEYGMTDIDELNEKENPFQKYTPEWLERSQDLNQRRQDCLDNGFKNLSHIFHHLWD